MHEDHLLNGTINGNARKQLLIIYFYMELQSIEPINRAILDPFHTK